ncbi:MAG: VCBS repeat-containing protein [Bacteroidota bacterium]
MKKCGILISLCCCTWACTDNGGALFKIADPKETGISFANTLTPTEDLNILDYLYFYNGGGVAIGDVNNDDLPDLFFSGNQVKNKLYLNQGGLNFKDVSERAGIGGNSDWNTGTVMGDVNGDGLLDIYVCAVVGLKGLDGHNELFINNGPSADGLVTFTESAAEYGLDFDTYSSSAAFLDYDRDGDLDMYLLNHAVHTQESYGRADLRTKRDFQTGDKLLRNEEGFFVDVSEEAEIYGGPNGYGLSVAVSDFNRDGWPDLYISNDFHEDDYYYLNKGDGTFRESLTEYFSHTSRFSMGSDVGDINHDGWPDLMTLDMLPEKEKVLKASQGDVDPQIMRLQTQEFGYHYQYSRNMLQLNKGNHFSEVGLQSGVAATDWSWSALLADYDQDGRQDIFISTGIPKRPNDLDFINFVSSEQIKNKINTTKLVDQEALDLMPSGKIHNYIFQGTKAPRFTNKSGVWIPKDTLVSGATAMGDLDNDGDLDLVTNNINGFSSLYRNTTNDQSGYLKIKLRSPGKNRNSIGAKVFSYHKGIMQYKELYTVRGFQASSEPIIHFGYGDVREIDSLKIIWPDGTYQVERKIAVNQTLKIQPESVEKLDYQSLQWSGNPLFQKIEDKLGLDFKHQEDIYSDFNRQKLMPYQVGDRGPATAVGDLNGDGREDVFFGGSKYIPSEIYIASDSTFIPKDFPQIGKDSIKEDVSAIIADFDQDGHNDLFLGSGGADFFDRMKPLLDSYYVKRDSLFEAKPLPQYFENASVLRPYDMDGDGDLDLFVGNQMVTNDFGRSPNSVILENEKGEFRILEDRALDNLGMVTDAVWEDFDRDGLKDLIVVGEFMAPVLLKNEKGSFAKQKIGNGKLTGLWQCVLPADIDHDGDTDLVLGNWGTNSKFQATAKRPLHLYYGDFDANGQSETITALEKDGTYYPLEGLDGLSSQIVSLRKKFNTYQAFAGKSMDDIFETSILKKATILEVNELRSGYLKNEEGQFTFVPFTQNLQMAPITALLHFDFDGEGKKEVLAGGNYFGVKPYHGRLGSFPGALIKDENEIVMGNQIGLDFWGKSIRHLHIIHFKDRPYLLVSVNDGEVQVYGFQKESP